MNSTTQPDSLTARALAVMSHADLASQLRALALDYRDRPVLGALVAEAARRLSVLAEGKP